jgi:aspartyl-tRNA(Asn)/glutamyl-tRNA(Gln) amidotransferase subunit A
MTDLPPAPGPEEPLTEPAPAGLGPLAPRAPGAGAERPAGGSRSEIDLSAALERATATRRFPGEGGPWVGVRPAARADAAPGGRPAGPLEGAIVGVKDLVAVAGLPLGAGSRTRAAAPPEPRDAAVVAALRAAGAVVAGTVALHELAFGVSGVNDEVGFPPNPHDAGRVPGGSSSGSAVAVADGSCDLAVGTDTGGSVRIPAALCGVVGFKPARGRYPLDGVLPLAPSLDQVGLLARSVAGIATAHHALTGDALATPPGGVAGLRIGVERAGVDAADVEVAGAIEAALGALAGAGCELVDVAWPDRDEVFEVTTTVMFAEAAAVHRALIAGPWADLLGAPVAERLRAGAAIGEGDYRAARAAADRLRVRARAVLDIVDAVVGPTVPIVAPTIEAARRDQALPRRLVAETRLANVAGVAALSLPLPVPAGRLPVGLQVTAASDGRALAAGSALTALLTP